jgi:hypothetical protein
MLRHYSLKQEDGWFGYSERPMKQGEPGIL